MCTIVKSLWEFLSTPDNLAVLCLLFHTFFVAWKIFRYLDIYLSNKRLAMISTRSNLLRVPQMLRRWHCNNIYLNCIWPKRTGLTMQRARVFIRINVFIFRFLWQGSRDYAFWPGERDPATAFSPSHPHTKYPLTFIQFKTKFCK